MKRAPTLSREDMQRAGLLLACSLLVSVWFLATQGGIPNVKDKRLHWDVPIYLKCARCELDYISLPQLHWWDEEQERLLNGLGSGPYRRLCRFGHIWLLSRVFLWAGSGIDGIQAAMSLYSIGLCLSLVLLFLFFRECLKLADEKDRPETAHIAAAFAGVLVLAASSLSSHINGMLISEVPALVCIAMFCLLWTKGMAAHGDYGRIACGAASGVILMALYLVRLESVWVPLCFVGAFSALFWSKRPFLKRFLLLSLFACATGSLCFSVWCSYVGPVASPFNFVRYAINQDVHPARQLTLQSYRFSLLRFAFFLPSLLLVRNKRLLAAATLWLLLSFIPFVCVFIKGGPYEARMGTVLMPPIGLGLALAAQSFLGILQRVRPGTRKRSWALFAAAFVFGLLSFAVHHDAVLNCISLSLPSRWKIPEREARACHIDELAKITPFLDSEERCALELMRGKNSFYAGCVSILICLQERPFVALECADPLKLHPAGPWYAIVSSEVPGQDTVERVLQTYRLPNDVQVEQVTDNPHINLFRVTGRYDVLSGNGKDLLNG